MTSRSSRQGLAGAILSYSNATVGFSGPLWAHTGLSKNLRAKFCGEGHTFAPFSAQYFRVNTRFLKKKQKIFISLGITKNYP